MFWQPEWKEPDADDFRVAAIVATEHWVIDGSYQSWIGQLVLGNAEVVVWLDLPMLVWLPRLLRRTVARGEAVKNSGPATESLRASFASRDSLILFTLRHYRGRRSRYPHRFASYDVIRLRSDAEVVRFLSAVDSRET